MTVEQPWVESPTMHLDRDVPAQRRFAEIPPEFLAMGQRLVRAVMAEIPAEASELLPLVRASTGGRFDEEVAALAQALAVDEADVMLANVSYDLVVSMFGCSTVVLPTPAGPVCARNMDWWPEDVLAQCSVLIRSHGGGQPDAISAGWPGASGVVTGLSPAGFGIVLNAVSCPEAPHLAGYPVLLFLRRVLEDAVDFDEALRLLSEQELVTSALITLIGTENEQRVVIERSPSRSALRWGEPGRALVTTNDFRLLFPPAARSGGAEIYETTCSRFDHLTATLAGHDPNRSVAVPQLLEILTDPGVIQGITAQHVLLWPRDGRAQLFVPRRLLG